MDEARIQWQQSEEKVKTLNEKLANALADITTKENLVKQHVKVAEEAVTGIMWDFVLLSSSLKCLVFSIHCR